MRVDSNILIYALRYSVSRKSSAFYDCREHIMENISEFMCWQLLRIIEDVEWSLKMVEDFMAWEIEERWDFINQLKSEVYNRERS